MNTSSTNQITLIGSVCEKPVLNHEVYGERFFLIKLKICRLSGQADILPVIVSERLLPGDLPAVGSRLAVEGQLRSYNLMMENKSRLQLQTFAREIHPTEQETDENKIVLDGFICKIPTYRVTPFSREISDVLIAVNRAYGKSDYIPTICWGRNARYCQQLNVGDPIRVEGRLQSREYQKKTDNDTVINKIAYEVSVSKLSVERDDADASAAEAEQDPIENDSAVSDSVSESSEEN